MRKRKPGAAIEAHDRLVILYSALVIFHWEKCQGDHGRYRANYRCCLPALAGFVSPHSMGPGTENLGHDAAGFKDNWQVSPKRGKKESLRDASLLKPAKLHSLCDVTRSQDSHADGARHDGRGRNFPVGFLGARASFFVEAVAWLW